MDIEQLERGLIRNYIKSNLLALLSKTKQIYPDKLPDAVYEREIEIIAEYMRDLTINFREQQTVQAAAPPAIVTPAPPQPVIIAETPEEPQVGKPICISRVMDMEKPISRLPNGQVIYGRRCKRPIFGDNQHCYFHIKNNPHGDFEVAPCPRIREHFEKKASKVAN
jgi:hypothetical protein